jgi:cyclopropane fatty-acyl-phospholipid synthase-like methyltransferase
MRYFGGIFNQLTFAIKYLGKPRWDTGISPPELLAFLKGAPPGRALDIGCGTGTNVITMARCGWDVTGLDFVGRAVNQAKDKIRAAGVQAEIRQVDVCKPLDLPGKYDFLLDLGCFHVIPLAVRDGYIANVKRWIAPGGTYLMYGFMLGKENSLPGISEADLERFSPEMRLTQRVDGWDSLGRASMWVTFEAGERINHP